MSPSPRPFVPLPLDLSPKGKTRLLLAVGVILTLTGFLIPIVCGSGSGWNAWLFLELGLSHGAATRIDLALVLGALTSAIAGLCFRDRNWGGYLMLPAFLYLLTNAFLIAKTGGSAHANWTPAAHALRYGTPLALVLLVMREPFGSAQITMLLRVGIAFVFITHGAEALMHYPRFIDLIIGSGENLLGWRITEEQAKTTLTVIGLVDLIVAVLVLVRPYPALLWWLAAWGFITALSRMTSLGWGAYPEVMERATHFLVPMALALWCRRR